MQHFYHEMPPSVVLMIFLEYNFDNKSNPITGLDRPIGFQEVEAPRFQDS
jgi:hypothetical protein